MRKRFALGFQFFNYLNFIKFISHTYKLNFSGCSQRFILGFLPSFNYTSSKQYIILKLTEDFIRQALK